MLTAVLRNILPWNMLISELRNMVHVDNNADDAQWAKNSKKSQ